jgi:small subunit ribosomal protein S26e
MEGVIAKELRQAGAILPGGKTSKWYCVSCAVHSHTVKIRSSADRKKKGRL